MNINRYLKKRKSCLPFFSFAFPCIPVLIAIINTIFALYAKSMGDILTMFSIAVMLISSLAVALPVCGGAGMLCSILALRKLGRKNASLPLLYGTDYGC